MALALAFRLLARSIASGFRNAEGFEHDDFLDMELSNVHVLQQDDPVRASYLFSTWTKPRVRKAEINLNKQLFIVSDSFKQSYYQVSIYKWNVKRNWKSAFWPIASSKFASHLANFFMISANSARKSTRQFSCSSWTFIFLDESWFLRKSAITELLKKKGCRLSSKDD